MGTTVQKPVDTSTLVVQQNNLPSEAHDVAGEQRQYGRRRLLNWIGPLAVLLLGALLMIPELVQKWLWMRQLDYEGIFWTLFSVKCGMTCVAFISTFLFLWINIRQAARNSFALAKCDPTKITDSVEKTPVIEIRGIPISRRVVTRTLVLTAVAVAASLCAWLHDAMGFVSPLSLRWLRRVVRSNLWTRRGVLSLSSSLLSAAARQSPICDGACDRCRRLPSTWASG